FRLVAADKRRYSAHMENPTAQTSAIASTGMSLDELSQALDAIGRPNKAAASGHEERFEEVASGQEIALRQILEAILFVGRPDNQPLESRAIAAMVGSISPEEVENLVAELNDDYVTNGCPYTIVSEGAGFRLTLRSEFS